MVLVTVQSVSHRLCAVIVGSASSSSCIVLLVGIVVTLLHHAGCGVLWVAVTGVSWSALSYMRCGCGQGSVGAKTGITDCSQDRQRQHHLRVL
jgi:hypothetical protein